MAKIRRRRFLQSAAALCGSALLGSEFAGVTKSSSSPLTRFKLGSISDGFAQDFEEALKILKGYGLRWVEIRNVWGIYNTEASSAQIARLKELLVKYEFKVSVVDTALFKCALPGTRPAEDARTSILTRSRWTCSSAPATARTPSARTSCGDRKSVV